MRETRKVKMTCFSRLACAPTSNFFVKRMIQLLLISKCWTFLRLVEYSFNFCWSTTTHFGAKLKWRTRKSPLLSLCASSVVAVIMKRRQKDEKKNHKILTREFGAYYILFAELRNLDISRPSRSFSSWWPQLSRSRRSTIPLGERLA